MIVIPEEPCHRCTRPIVAMYDVWLSTRLQDEFEGCVAEEVEASRIILSAVHAAHIEASVLYIQEVRLDAFHIALKYVDIGVLKWKAFLLSKPVHAVVINAVILWNHSLDSMSLLGNSLAQACHNVSKTANFGDRCHLHCDMHNVQRLNLSGSLHWNVVVQPAAAVISCTVLVSGISEHEVQTPGICRDIDRGA
eukprot:scaffold795_cov375-Prasinococcus_capsulatus_cf.AAC.37